MKEKLTLIIRKLFRYRLISIFFIISQLVVYSAIFGALSIYNKAYAKEMDKLSGIYDNRILMDVVTISKRDIFTYAGMDMEQGNLIMAGKLSLAFSEQGSNNRSEVIIKANEDLPYPMVEGRLPGSEPEDEGKNVVAIGRGKLKYATEEAGKRYITIESDKYEVIGIIGSESSDYWDYKLVFHVNSLDKNVKEAIISKGSYTFEISSNINKLDDAYKEVYSNITSVDGSALIESKKMNSTGDSYVLQSLETENMKINMLVYVFCIFNCMLMSEFWIIQRRKEIAVRKVYGMSDGKILKGIAGDMLGLCVVALVLFLAGSLLANVLSGEKAVIVMNPVALPVVVAAMFLIIALTMAYPVYKIMRMEPAKILGNGD